MTSSRHRTAVSALAMLTMLPLVACTSAPTAGTPTTTGPSQNVVVEDGVRLVRSTAERTAPADAATAGAATSRLGTSLLAALPGDGNAVLSPYSVYTALAMVRPGATGACATELDTLLEPDSAAVVTAVDEAMAQAEVSPTSSDNREVVFDTANSVWAADGTVAPSYLDDLAEGFDAGLHLADFRGDPEAARVAINRWVADRTHDLIPELIREGVIDQSTVLTLVNALYLAAQWQALFQTSPVPIDFAAPSGQVAVPGFGGTGSFAGSSGEDWRSVTLPYVGAGVAMTLIVPDAGAFDAVAGRLDAALIADAIAGEYTVLERLQVPEFSVDTPTDLTGLLAELGGPALFTGGCLTGMVDGSNLEIAAVVHQAVVDVDKDGTVAAAATAVAVVESAAPQPEPGTEFVVDRPFFFVIHDTLTGAPLFLGRISDPTA